MDRIYPPEQLTELLAESDFVVLALPLTNEPNVIFSPHISGEMPDYEASATEVFCENLKRYLAGEPFVHEVDKEKEY